MNLLSSPFYRHSRPQCLRVWEYRVRVSYGKLCAGVTWDQALFSCRFLNNIPAGMAKRILAVAVRENVWEPLKLDQISGQRRSSQNLAIWASQRMLFVPTKTFCFFYIYFIAKVLCCFGIRTEEIQLTALKNFQGSKALVVAAEKILLNVPNHRFETWSSHMLDSWLNISVDYFTRR